MAVNSLGSRTFIAIHPFGDPHGKCPVVREEPRITQRPGVDGTGIILTGERGQPFPALTFRDFTSLANAHAEFEVYRAMIGDGGGYNAPYQLIHWDVNYTTAHGTGYVVLDVMVRQMKPIKGATGGLVTNPTHVLVAEWTLLPVGVA